jgi:hypothetical protein
MRISLSEQAIIGKTLRRYFGDESGIWLFGSRVIDSARGGDIDLYVEPVLVDVVEVVDAKLMALRDLHLALGDQKIDMVINCVGSPSQAIYQIARQQGVRL